MTIPVSPTKMNSSDPKKIGGVWSFIKRFNDAVDWLISLSPAGSTQYRTAWTDIPLASGYSSDGLPSPQVRRVGTTLEYRGAVKPTSGTFATGAGVVIGASPAGLRPTTRSYRDTEKVLATGSAGSIAKGSVGVDGNITLTAVIGAPGGIHLAGLTGIPAE